MSFELQRPLLRFGSFEFDLASGDLSKGGRRIRLQNQPRQVLQVLVSRPGELVTREELHRQLWPSDTFVDFDSGLNVAIRKIRTALGDLAPSPVFIETERAQGYRFIAPVSEVKPAVQPAVNPSAASDPPLPPSSGPGLHRPDAHRPKWFAVGAGIAALVAGLTLWRQPSVAGGPAPTRPLSYERITNFSDSAVAPSLSPDGRVVAFYRSNQWFLTPDQVWVKRLPDGEPVQLTNLGQAKYGLAFSPDGSRIAFTMSGQPGWRTLTVSPLGGESTLMLQNAAGLGWIGPDQLLFSEIRRGLHMGIVTSRQSRADRREVYFPAHERAMAHFSYLSPDRKWVLLIEMDHSAAWQPCRVVPFDGSTAGWTVGPRGACTAATWSPDGRWMYFTAEVDGGSHLWRQGFPRGDPEQLSFGPGDESGVALFPDGRSLITSAGTNQSELWIRDGRGDRPLTSQGYVTIGQPSARPKFSADGRQLYYLLRRDSSAAPSELRRVEVETERSEAVFPGFPVFEFDISANGEEALLQTESPTSQSQTWLAPFDGRAPPKRIGDVGDGSAHFGLEQEIVFRMRDGAANYLAAMNLDGSGRRRLAPYPIANLHTVSPDGQWAVALAPFSTVPGAPPSTLAIPTAGGTPREICPFLCFAYWSPDARFMYLTLRQPTLGRPGETFVIPLRPGQMVPDLPTGGLRAAPDVAQFPGTTVIPVAYSFPSSQEGTLAYVKAAMHRNLFRVTLP